ncbi:hypothetical protein RintRC_3523 [Richelia intracellularis]|nr:hypothetical protein RintRC_3523 [Richelia intracellularis]
MISVVAPSHLLKQPDIRKQLTFVSFQLNDSQVKTTRRFNRC